MYFWSLSVSGYVKGLKTSAKCALADATLTMKKDPFISKWSGSGPDLQSGVKGWNWIEQRNPRRTELNKTKKLMNNKNMDIEWIEDTLVQEDPKMIDQNLSEDDMIISQS